MNKQSVAIIGSFQKFYTEVTELISLFSNRGLIVTSPYKSKIVETRSVVNGSGFVIFDADDKAQTDVEIQLDTLRKILKADAVYVYNPMGYVGRTTCFEIGVLISKNKPLYYFAPPTDLPVPLSPKQILDPDSFATTVLNRTIQFELPNNLSVAGLSSFNSVFNRTKHSLVLCGSMNFYDKMMCIQSEMEKSGVLTIVPTSEDSELHSLPEAELRRFKRQVSNSYLRKIRDKKTLAILVVNEDKHGQQNYIGANTLVEIGMAFTWGKKIFLLNDIYEPLKDELLAWDCESIQGDLSKIVQYFTNQGMYTNDSSEQLTMFDSLMY